MNNMENCVYKKISTDEKVLLKVYITLLEKSIKLIIFENGKAWKANVSQEKLQKYASEHEMHLKNYCETLLEYVNDGSSDIIFSFNKERFTVSKLLKKSLMLKIFSSDVEEVNYVQCTEEITDKFYLETVKLSQLVSTLKRDNEEVTKNKLACEIKLKELLNQKQQTENEQLSKFLLVLNEKKHRIQHLTELLHAFRNGRTTVSVKPKVPSKRKHKDQNSAQLPKKETISESESSEDDTSTLDEHHTDCSDSTEDNSVGQPQTSTSTDVMNLLEDDFDDRSHILPKKIKKNDQQDASIVIAPAATAVPPPEIEVAERRKSPEIDLSTQQLLDLL